MYSDTKPMNMVDRREFLGRCLSALGVAATGCTVPVRRCKSPRIFWATERIEIDKFRTLGRKELFELNRSASCRSYVNFPVLLNSIPNFQTTLNVKFTEDA